MISFPVSHSQLQHSPHCSLLPPSEKFPDVSFSFSSYFSSFRLLPLNSHVVIGELPRKKGEEGDGRAIRGFSGRFFAHRRRTRERQHMCVFCFLSRVKLSSDFFSFSPKTNRSKFFSPSFLLSTSRQQFSAFGAKGSRRVSSHPRGVSSLLTGSDA
ncbi:uncharacterized protein K489DRAFT_55829 [Dissoconium aciculare CBS 342.82]|uniref:Uncharacterized protein n=1 Tax=Dissoconium aciculare CBS 342.82 TaxID=1314786 RepID=A0A6J3LXE6_9PEZI|nr:uncharacterized protein K489DRAFT_55829 [Dissoconium aciculare CBS 342.82]KAF1820426.1 hypothetical protein K489DRAFT_55829 [Dissoconium aciculare CBS 342.82]